MILGIECDGIALEEPMNDPATQPGAGSIQDKNARIACFLYRSSQIRSVNKEFYR